jgi:large subunit ribosomal protein L5
MDNPDKADKPAKPERPEKKARPDKQAKPEKSAKAEAPEKPEKIEKPKGPARLMSKYHNEIIPGLMAERGYQNRLAVPRLVKVCVNMGVGKAREDAKAMEQAAGDLALITGQKGVITKARKSISNFRLRKGYNIGCKATLRGRRMYEFFDRLVNIAMPRIRDFRGLSPKGFDGRGNYTLGLSEQTTFPEVDPDKVQFTQGMDITIVTTARTDAEGQLLLGKLGMPFAAR